MERMAKALPTHLLAFAPPSTYNKKPIVIGKRCYSYSGLGTYLPARLPACLPAFLTPAELCGRLGRGVRRQTALGGVRGRVGE